MDLDFSGEIFFWRGPAPWYFITVPEAESDELAASSNFTSYGWGCIPVTARIGDTSYTTSLFPKDGGYLVPVKVAVRRAEGLDLGDVVDISLSVEESGLLPQVESAKHQVPTFRNLDVLMSEGSP